MRGSVPKLMAKRYPGMVMQEKRGSTHFLPMEAPYEVREVLSEFLSRLIEGFSAGEDGPVRRMLAAGERG